MTESIGRRTRWSAPKLDRHEDLIVEHRLAGASLRDLQRLLRTHKTRASVSTISRYLKSLTPGRFVRNPGESAEPSGVRSNRHRQTRNDVELPLAVQKQNFRRRRASDQARYWVQRGLALGEPRHGRASDGKIHSVGTKRNYEGVLTRFCRWIQTNKMRDLESVSLQNAMKYLNERAGQVGQKTLDLDRQAIQYLFRQTSGANVRLERVKSSYTGGRSLATEPRAYTFDQVEAVCSRLSARAALAARIAYAAGLRAHELVTLRPAGELHASAHRKWSKDRFLGQAGKLYVVVGKGGLRREVMLPFELATELENRRLNVARAVRDRGVNYTQYYDIAGGKKMSERFTTASKKTLGWSGGLHGLRHSYTQNRMSELQQLGYGREERKSIVSQELGHFRTTETETYLR